MLKFLTGQPGNGKTLYALRECVKRALDEGRPVFLSGVPLTPEGEAALPGCLPLGDIKAHVEKYVDPERGADQYRFTLPPNSLVVIDEAQRVFPKRGNTGNAPPHVAAFETHRHEGLDFVLMTQHPKLLDSHLRPLAGWHWHLVRRAGLEKTNVYAWEECEDDPMAQGAKGRARHSTWEFPKEVYSWYRSAEAHTHKRNLPWKQILFAVGALLVVVVSVLYTVRHVTSGAGVVVPESAQLEETTSRGLAPGVERLEMNPWDATRRAARVEGIERTAPVFDPLQKVQSQPKIAGCMQLRIGSRTDCSCTTPQGSRLNVDKRECMRLVREGWFDETKPERNAKEENIHYLNARDASGGREGAPQATPAASRSPS